MVCSPFSTPSVKREFFRQDLDGHFSLQLRISLGRVRSGKPDADIADSCNFDWALGRTVLCIRLQVQGVAFDFRDFSVDANRSTVRERGLEQNTNANTSRIPESDDLR
jgi:hypothetical protein